MGVPKFYRWLSERYPCLSEVVKEYQIPEFDNLYLDMNGIIHICSHPNDDDPHFRITQEKIFVDIFHYIEWLFRLIKPRKVFFMAVDGVAPRAKMNQQRGRRFRTAREACDADAKARERGEVLPTEERFDSNCITPGTEFMVKLQEQLKYFVNSKITSDPLWQGPRIFLSGHETPGEGEHKIMDFIRYERSQSNYDPNTRHCLYGLDADLIMLGLCTHDPHFSLLREEVRYTGKKSQKRIPTPEETTYHLLHLSLLREYLEHEFSPIKEQLSFPFDTERIVDDWVLMGFLVGNDFIPNLPHLHIVHGALPTLYKTYMEVLPTLDGYINENGKLNLARFEKYMVKLSECDYENFNNQYADLKWLESKKNSNGFKPRRGKGRHHKCHKGQNLRQMVVTKNQFETIGDIDDDAFHDAADVVPVGKLIDLSDSDGGGEVEEDGAEEDTVEDPTEEAPEDENDLFKSEFGQHKRNYYMEKLEYERVTAEVLRDQAECFVRAIQWNLHYYYDGVCSWSWYYPHHYAPYISDIRGFAGMTLTFDYGTPFRPFEQLLAVLPAASKKLLPEPYQFLMCDGQSPVIDYYPVDFTTDLNGKQQDWEAVVQIPFIEEKRLLSAMQPLNEKLTPDEMERNSHGPCLMYTYSENSQGSYPSALPGKLLDIAITHAKCTHIRMEEFRVPPDKLRKGLCEGIRLDVHFPGFPTLKHIRHTAQLKKAEVKVFQMVSRGENMIIKIEGGLDMDVETAAKELVNSSVYVGWPHLIEAKVSAVSDSNCRFTDDEILRHQLSRNESEVWFMQRESAKETYMTRWGVEIGESKVLVHAVPLIGRKYVIAHGTKVTLKKLWASVSVPYALQTVVKDIEVHDSSFQQYRSVEELFPVDSVCFVLTTPNYGCMAKVIQVCEERVGFVEVKVEELDEPDLERILHLRSSTANGYMPGYLVAQKLGISGLLLSRITGTLYIKGGTKGKPAINQKHSNIGLNLKFNKKNEEAYGYAKKTGDTWTYSTKTVEVMELYLQRFPELFDYLQTKMREDNYYEDDIIAACNGQFTFKDILAFLKLLPSHSASHQQCGSETIEAEVVKKIEAAVDTIANAAGEPEVTVMEVKAKQLFRPNYSQGCSLPDPEATYQLLDRVVNIRSGYSVPLGLRGTIIGVQMADKQVDIVYQIVFDKEFSGGLTIRCSPNRGYLLPSYALINLSHGHRLEHPHIKPTAVVHPQYAKPNGSSMVFENSQLNKGNGGKNGRNENRAHRQSSTASNTTTTSTSSSVHTDLQINAIQGTYPNTLNHSPNSPFVARQPQLLRNRPQFVTPKMPTSAYQASPRLQTNVPKKNIKVPKIPALQLAAKSLPKEQSPASSEVQPRQGPPPMPAFGLRLPDTGARGADCGSEFSSMFRALESRSKPEASTVEREVDSLSGLLQLLGTSEGKGAPASTAAGTSQSGHQYSKQISVEQLFKETRENEIKTASQEPSEFAALELGITNYVMALMTLVQEQFGGVPTYEYMQMGPRQSVSSKVKLPDGSLHYGVLSPNNRAAAESAAKQAFLTLSKDIASGHLVDQSSTFSGGVLPHPSLAVVNRTGAPVRMNPVHLVQPALIHASGRQLPPSHPPQPLHPHMMHPLMYPPPHGGQRPVAPYPGAYLPPSSGGYLMPAPVMPPAYFPQPTYGAVDPRLNQAGPWGRDNWQGPHLQQHQPPPPPQQHLGQQRPTTDNPFVPLQVTRQKPKKFSTNDDSCERGFGQDTESSRAESGLAADGSAAGKSGSQSLNWRERNTAGASSESRGRQSGKLANNKQQSGRKSRLAINFASKKQ